MFLAGMVTGMAVLALVLYINNRKLDVRWYEWFIGVLGFGLLLFTLQNIWASASEYWESAPLVFLWLFGTPALTLIIISILLPFLRYWLKRKRQQALERRES